MIVNITKENQSIVITIQESENPVIFNCKTHVLTSFTKRTRKTIPPECRTAEKDIYFEIMNNIEDILKYNYPSDNENLSVKEAFIPYLDIVDNFPCECPKGYINFVLENHLRFSKDTLAIFRLFKRMKNFSEHDKKNFYMLFKLEAYSANILNSLPLEELKIFIKIFNVTMKTPQWNLGDLCRTFIYQMGYNFDLIDVSWTSCVDLNRGLAENATNIEMLKNSKQEKEIIENEKQITSIEELSTDKFIIVVPKKLKDFTNEGRQQNNCVGHYYHNSIARGENLVYFIRHANTPITSFVTCRFNVNSNCTTEYRVKNNCEVTDREVKELIETIDEKIRELLK